MGRAPTSPPRARPHGPAAGHRHSPPTPAAAGWRLAVIVVALALVAAVAVLAWTPVRRHLGLATSESSSPDDSGVPLDPSYFATGSCEAFAPTAGDRHITVFLDAGHGGVDPGGVGTTESGATVQEADETLPVELDAMALLRAEGYRVVVSRTTANTVLRLGPADTDEGVLSLQGAHDDVAARDVCADDARAAVLVGIYFDAAASPDAAGSLAAWDAARPFAAANERLATLVQDDVLAALNAEGWGIPNDGVVSDTTLGSYVGNPDAGGLATAAADYDHLLLLGPAEAGYFSTPSTMPGTVVEPLYITDPFEGSVAASTEGQEVMAQGIAKAVEQFLAPARASSS